MPRENVQLKGEMMQDQIGEVVRGSVEEARNALRMAGAARCDTGAEKFVRAAEAVTMIGNHYDLR